MDIANMYFSKSIFGSLLFVLVMLGALFLNVANAILLLMGWVLYSALTKKKEEAAAAGIPGLLMLVLAGWLTLSQFWSGVGSVGWFTTWIFLAIPLVFLGWQGYAGNRPAVWSSTQIFLALLGCVAAMWGITQVVMLGYPRATGPLADPNTYGSLLNLLWFPLLARFITMKSNRTVWFVGFALLIIHLALMMSGSRAASLIWLLLCTIMIALYWNSITKARLAFICAMAAGNYLVYSFFSNHLQLSSYKAAFDVLQTAQPAESPRLLMWQSTVRMWLDSPWLGSGLGSWNYLYPMYRLPDETGTTGYYAHNDYLQLLQEGGVITLLIFVGVVGWLGVYSVKALTRLPSSTERIENAGIVAGIAAATIHAFVNFTFYLIYINVLIGIYLGKLFQAPSKFPQGTGTSSYSQIVQLEKTAILVLIAINGFHAIFSSAGLALLRNDSFGERMVHVIAPQLNQFSVAVLLASIRPSDSTAQRYITASIENGVINSPSVSFRQAREMFDEVIDGYKLLRSQNKYDAAALANEAEFLVSFGKRYGIDSIHFQRAKKLLQESLRMDPSRADSAIMLAEIYFIEGQPQEAFNSLAKMARMAWSNRDRMLIEAEILKHKKPEYASLLSELQEELRGMRIHCSSNECGARYAQIERSAHEKLSRLTSSATP